MSGSGYERLIFGSKDFDTDNAFDLTTGRFSPRVPGYYQLTASMGTDDQRNTYATVAIFKNGAKFRQGVAVSTNYCHVLVTAIVFFDGVSDYVEAFGYENTLLSLSDGTVCYFQGAFVRRA